MPNVIVSFPWPGHTACASPHHARRALTWNPMMTHDDRDETDARPRTPREARRDALVRDIADRLRHVCQHLTGEEFAQLVADIAETRLRFAAIDAEQFRRAPAQGPRPAAGGDKLTDQTKPDATP